MVITSAFQADFVGSSPITRIKNVSSGRIEHIEGDLALSNAISQTRRDRSSEELEEFGYQRMENLTERCKEELSESISDNMQKIGN